jgi:alpha-galactosidase/6-phospho-beta-glucosidase family protein
LSYGVNQGIGGDIGPGGVFLSLRYMPLMLAVCRDMEELCPAAMTLMLAVCRDMEELCPAAWLFHSPWRQPRGGRRGRSRRGECRGCPSAA